MFGTMQHKVLYFLNNSLNQAALRPETQAGLDNIKKYNILE